MLDLPLRYFLSTSNVLDVIKGERSVVERKYETYISNPFGFSPVIFWSLSFASTFASYTLSVSLLLYISHPLWCLSARSMTQHVYKVPIKKTNPLSSEASPTQTYSTKELISLMDQLLNHNYPCFSQRKVEAGQNNCEVTLKYRHQMISPICHL